MADIRKIVDRLVEVSGLKQKEIAEQLYKITPNNFSGKIRDGILRLPPIIDWAVQHDVDLNWLFTGQAAKATPELKVNELAVVRGGVPDFYRTSAGNGVNGPLPLALAPAVRMLRSIYETGDAEAMARLVEFINEVHYETVIKTKK